MATELDTTCSNEFIFLKQLVESGKARFDFNRFFLTESYTSWLFYRGNTPLTWIYVLSNFIASQFFIIPLSVILAWWFHTWWIVILGVVFSWLFWPFILRIITPAVLRKALLRDENFLNHLWSERPFRVMIYSTEMEPSIFSPETGQPIIGIVPPQPWQTAVNKFGHF